MPEKSFFIAPALVVAAALLMPALSIAAYAGSDSASLFAQGTVRLSIFLGGGTAFDQNYTVVGAGGGYFVSDGVEVGLDGEAWLGNTPRIEQVSPQIRVILDTPGSMKPYAGAFYRRTHIEGYRDADTVGARAGLYFLAGSNAYVGAGLAQDVHLNCDTAVYASCAETYPEVFLAILFR